MSFTMRAMHIITVLILMSLTLCHSEAKNPGVKSRITGKGISFANTVARDKLAKELKNLKIPDQGGKDGHIEWSLKNIQNRGSTAPTSSMALTSGQNGITWTMSGLGIKLHADWRVKYRKGWVKASTSGSVDVEVRGVGVDVTIKLGADAQGRPTISMAGCNAKVSDVKLKFHGGTAWILNLFKGKLGRKVRDMLQGQICKIIQKEVNVDGAKAMSKLKVSVPFAKHFLLDYGLLQAPSVQAKYMDIDLKGEVYWIGDKTEAPFSPKPFPPVTSDSKMMYLWLSDYAANTAAYTGQKHSYLRYNLTANDLPEGNRSYLNTTCKLACIGKLIPQIGKKYPNSQVEARVISTSAPVLSTSKKAMTFETTSIVNLYAQTPDKKTPFLLTLSVNLSLSWQVSVVDEKLTGKITNNKFKVGVLKSDVGKVNEMVLNLMLGGVMKLAVIPKINEIAKQGMDLPVTGSIKFANTSIEQFDGGFVVSTDLKATPTSNALMFKSEIY